MVDFVDFYKDLHDHEMEMRERVQSRVQAALTIFVALSGTIGFLAQNVEQHHSGSALNAFWVFMIVGVGCLLYAGYNITVASIGHIYKETPFAQAIADQREKLKALYAQYDSDYGTDELAKNEAAFLQERFTTSATINAGINDRKSWHLLLANRALVASTVATFGAFALFIFGNIKQQAGVTTVEFAKPADVRVLSLPAVSVKTCSVPYRCPPADAGTMTYKRIAE